MAFEEPVGVFVPYSAVEGFDGFGEAVFAHVAFDLELEVVQLAADPVFAHAISVIGYGRIRIILPRTGKSSHVFLDDGKVGSQCGSGSTGHRLLAF